MTFDDRGVVGGAEVPAFGVAVFVIGTLLAMNIWATVDGHVTASAAAREAARVYVEAPDVHTAHRVAHAAAADAVRAHGRDPDRLTLRIVHADGRGFARCVPVEITAGYDVALATAPGLVSGPSRRVHATQAERIDPWRSGLAAGGCT